MRDRSLFTYKVLMALIRLCSNKSLTGLGHAGDSFNDVISKLLRIQRSYQEKQQQPQMQQQQESDDDENNSTSSDNFMCIAFFAICYFIILKHCLFDDVC